MGQGYCYTCKKCKHKYTIHLGSGMRFPTVYQSILADISQGKYGSDWQELYKSIPYAAINGEGVIYVCSGCGSWELGTDVSLYAPNDPDSISQKQYGTKTVAEWGYVPYVMPWDLTNDYHLVKRQYHRCSKCGKRMHKASSAELKTLPCPECGSENQADGDLMWD